MSEFATARHQFAEAVAVAQILAAVVERNFGRIVGHATAGGKTGRVGMSPAEVIEPERGIVLARIVFDQRELRPAHGTGQTSLLRLWAKRRLRSRASLAGLDS